LQLSNDVVRIVTPGVDVDVSGPREKPGPGVRLVTVTRLAETYKNVDVVIAAMREPSLSSAALTIVGDGPSRPVLEQLTRELGLTHRVWFAGAVDESSLETIYRGSDLFVLPSTGEGFGLVYAEAMAHGLPCVGTRGCGAEDAIIDGVTGRLVDAPPQPASVAAAVLWSLDPRRYRSLSGRAIERARTELSADAFGARLLGALQRGEQ
jgi:phosphatidylinositol alpha-1,6-mannosyltransferase